MDKETVISLRTRLKQNNIPLRIWCDNEHHFDESDEFIAWDDANEIIYAIRPTTLRDQGTGHAPDIPMQVVTTSYEQIQYIVAAVNKEYLDKIVAELQSDGLVTDDNIKVINKYVHNLTSLDKYL